MIEEFQEFDDFYYNSSRPLTFYEAVCIFLDDHPEINICPDDFQELYEQR